MATEIFIEPELENLLDEQVASEWFEIASELGLQNQLELSSKSETNTAPPYMYVDPKTMAIITTLCPCREKYTEYHASTIPLDVLQEIQKCVKHGWYERIDIHYDNKSPDPFVVGVFKEDSWREHRHLIARWGAELVPMEQLEGNAVARLRDEAKGALLELKTKVDVALTDVDVFVKQMLAGKDAPRMTFQAGERSFHMF